MVVKDGSLSCAGCQITVRIFREQQIVRSAKYVGTMIGPDGYVHRWTAPRKNHPARVENQCPYQKPGRATVRPQDLCGICVELHWLRAPNKATFKAEAHALQCATAGPYNAIPYNQLGVGSVCGLGPDLVGIHSVSLAARYRTAACSNTLNQGLDKIQAARGYNFAPIFALCPNWEKEFLTRSMARSTAEAFNIVCRLDRNGKLDEVSQDKKQKVATKLAL